MRQFYLSKNSCGYYRVHFVDPVTGVQGHGKSTHTKDREEANKIAYKWLYTGAPEARGNSHAFNNSETPTISAQLISLIDNLSESDALKVVEKISRKFNFDSSSPALAETVEVPKTETVPVETVIESPRPKKIFEAKKKSVEAPSSTTAAETRHHLCETLEYFWDFDNSEYIRRTLEHGHSITRKHAFCMHAYVKNYWRPYFGDEICIEDLTLEELDDFFFFLHDEQELANETVNKNINMANKCFKTLLTMKKIKANPLDGIERFKTDNEERGIPTEQEVRELLNLTWENDYAKLAFKVAAFYGLRAGEISGLRVCDIDPVGNMLHVRHSYSEVDKLKTPKNKEIRDLPFDHALALQLLSHARENPGYNDLSYVFWSVKDYSKPVTPGYYADCFYAALEQIGVSEAQRKDRNIVFHSLRHFCCTILKQRADKETVMAIMGHKSSTMTDHYADHETQEKFNNMRNVISGVWEKYISA